MSPKIQPQHQHSRNVLSPIQKWKNKLVAFQWHILNAAIKLL